MQIDRRQNVEAPLLRGRSRSNLEGGNALVFRAAMVRVPPALSSGAVCRSIDNPYGAVLRDFFETVAELRCDDNAYCDFHGR